MSEITQNQDDRVPENMQLVINALNAHPGIVVVGGFERTFLDPDRCPPMTDGVVAHSLEIFTRPASPIYEPEPLNELAATLIGNLPTSYRKEAEWVNFTASRRIGFPSRLSVPVWQVDDVIDSVTMQGAIRPHAESTVVRTGQLPLETPLSYNFTLLQRTVVAIFPDEHHIADDITDNLGYYRRTIPKKQLGKSQSTDVSILKHAPALGYPPSAAVEDLLKARDALRRLNTRGHT
jgi:hypothetical protein